MKCDEGCACMRAGCRICTAGLFIDMQWMGWMDGWMDGTFIVLWWGVAEIRSPHRCDVSCLPAGPRSSYNSTHAHRQPQIKSNRLPQSTSPMQDRCDKPTLLNHTLRAALYRQAGTKQLMMIAFCAAGGAKVIEALFSVLCAPP